MFASISLPLGIFPPRNFEYRIPPALTGSLRPGSLVWVPFHGRKRWAVVESLSAKPAFSGRHQCISGILHVPQEALDIATPLIRRLAERCFTSWAFAARTALPLSFLARSGTAAAVPAATILRARGKTAIQPADFQKGALEALQTNFEGARRPVYCWGPTGSGKTYVLLAFISALLKKGRSSIYLVPEISLTPQFLEIFINELPEGTPLACWSSNMKLSEKRAVWHAALEGRVQVILGTRSASFLPLKNLGVVVVDEEQDSSFKQENPPSYHAREIALWRAQEQQVVAVMASATPSLECYQWIKQGRLLRLDLSSRYNQSKPAQISILELKSPTKLLTEPVMDALRQTLSRGHGAIVFHNRRGALRGMRCKTCSAPLLCGRCDLPMILHREPANGEPGGQSLRCHHCGIRKRPPKHCPRCHGPASGLEAHSFGTQHIAQDLEKMLSTPVLRLDKDTSSGARGIYERFKEKQAQVLVGTQLVSKGWHFPHVALMAVLDADTEMTLPDFRACERTYQTLVQAAGRTGRAGIAGQVLVGTRHPDHYVFTSLKEGNPETFYEKELSIRREMKLPPFSRLLAIEIRGKNRAKVEEATESLKTAISGTLEKHNDKPNETAELIGSAPGFFYRIRGLWRYYVVLRIPEHAPPLLTALGATVARHKKSAVTLRLHMDPYRLL